MNRQLSVIVKGKVQGVWYRAWTQETARELGLTGWVRNKADGSVAALAQGDEETLNEFLDRLHDGPPLARVTTVDTAWSDPEEEFTAFDLRK